MAMVTTQQPLAVLPGCQTFALVSGLRFTELGPPLSPLTPLLEPELSLLAAPGTERLGHRDGAVVLPPLTHGLQPWWDNEASGR